MIIHSHTKNQVNISNHSEKKWWQQKYLPKFESPTLNEFQSWSVTNDYNSHINNQVNISNHNEIKLVTTKYLAKFQSPRAITRPKIIGLERNVNLICNLSLYIHIPNIKSISQSIAKKKLVTTLFYFGIADMGNTMYRPFSGGGIKKKKKEE